MLERLYPWVDRGANKNRTCDLILVKGEARINPAKACAEWLRWLPRCQAPSVRVGQNPFPLSNLVRTHCIQLV